MTCCRPAGKTIRHIFHIFQPQQVNDLHQNFLIHSGPSVQLHHRRIGRSSHIQREQVKFEDKVDVIRKMVSCSLFIFDSFLSRTITLPEVGTSIANSVKVVTATLEVHTAATPSLMEVFTPSRGVGMFGSCRNIFQVDSL